MWCVKLIGAQTEDTGAVKAATAGTRVQPLHAQLCPQVLRAASPRHLTALCTAAPCTVEKCGGHAGVLQQERGQDCGAFAVGRCAALRGEGILTQLPGPR